MQKMNYFRPFAALLLSLAFLTPIRVAAADNSQVEKIRIMTYNIPMGNIPAVGINTWANRCIGIQDYLNEVKPDLLGLQEPVRTELMNLLSGMPGYTMLGRARDDGRESGEYSPILYRTERFYVEHTGTYWLSLTPNVVSRNWNSACNRVATWAVFRDKKTGARFLYTNTHLDHKSDSARQHQMEVIKSKMVELRSTYGSMPMMLTGDFNVQSTATAYSAATSYLINMKDAWLTAKEKEGSGITWYASNKKIDYIMLTTNIEVEKAYTFESQLPSGQILSDHNPHYADITWTTNKVGELAYNAVYEANESMDSLFVYKKTKTKLITNAIDGDAGCQFYCDAVNTSEGQYYKNLTDGSFNTYFHSMDTNQAPNNPHYLQVDLQRNDITRFYFQYARRNHSNYGVADRWVDVMVTGSNDNKNWEYVAEIDGFGSDAMELQESPVIEMHKPYRYVRFSVQHTPAMKIRNAHPQFSCSEFQMLTADVDSASSSGCYDETLKSICENELRPQVAQVEAAIQDGTVTLDMVNELKALTEKLRSNKIRKEELQSMISTARQKLNDFSAGDAIGQTTEAAYQTLKTTVSEVSASLPDTPTRALVDALIARLQSALESFETNMKTFATDKWYYITSSYRGYTAYGRALYAGGNASNDSLYAGYYDILGDSLTCKNNPYAMWRIQDMGDGNYALQNRATGFYFGQWDDKHEVFAMSSEACPWRLELKGERDVHLSPANGTAVAQPYVTTLRTGLATQGEGGHRSLSSWMFHEVDDRAVGLVEIPLRKNGIMVLSLPFAVGSISENNPGLTTYTMNSVQSVNVFHLQKKDSFAAGEAFFVMTGQLEDLEENSSETVLLKVQPPTELDTEDKEFNGLFSVLGGKQVYNAAYYMVNNVLRASSNVVIPAHEGYVQRNKVVATGQPADLTLVRNGGVTGIIPIAARQDGAVDMYSVDGRMVRRGVQLQDAFEGLHPGIYVINGRKVVVTNR